MKQKYIFIGCGVIVASFFMMLVFIVLVQSTFLKGIKGKKGGRIGVVQISGVIHSGGSTGGPFSAGTSGSDTIVKALKKGMEDDSIKAILLHINSPGGSPAGSYEIYSQIMSMRGKGKPIIVSMGDVAASGGYYIAAAGETVFANPSTLTGSIGVRMGYINWAGLMEEHGVEGVTIKAGKYKDIGSPFRPMTDEERAILQASVDNIHTQFIRDVANGRGLKERDVRKVATGVIYTGEQAKEIKLIDKLGTYHDAIDYTARQARIKGEPELINLGQDNIFPLFQTVANKLSGMPLDPRTAGSINTLVQNLLLVSELAPQ
jgi:protease-4